MTTYTYSEARQNLASLLEKAQREGEVVIRRQDGSTFIVRPVALEESPLNVAGIDLKMLSDEIVSILRESRER